VEVALKDDGGADEEISEDVNIIIKVLGEEKILTTHISTPSELDIGKVAKIEIRYLDDEPVISVSPDPQMITLGGGGSGGTSHRTCSEINNLEDSYNCGCMPCSARIIPYLEQALMGPLSGADISLHIASEYRLNTPLYVTKASTGNTLSSAGIISVPKAFTNALNDNELYIIEARGGIDIDTNDDFKIDGFETLSRGSLHTVMDGRTLKGFGYKLNVLTEIAYQNVKKDIGVLSDIDVLNKLNEISTLLMNGKIDPNSSSVLAYEDLLGWLPTFDKSLLFYDYDTKF